MPFNLLKRFSLILKSSETFFISTELSFIYCLILFSHGDEVVALAVSGVTFARGEKAYVIATGSDSGKVTNVAADNIDLGYWVTEVSAGNSTVAITLGFNQTVTGGKA